MSTTIAETERTGDAFDPSQHLMKISGAPYMKVQWRLVWLRTSYPDAVIVTEAHLIDDTIAIFRAQASLPTGGSATGWGSERPTDFADYIEKAECVPLRSRMLTRRGFVRYDELVIGEPVLAYDGDTDTCLWTPLREIKVFREAPVIALQNGWGYSLECTPDHTWPVRYTVTQKGKRYAYHRLVRASDLKTYHQIILAAPAPGGNSPITPEEAAIIGWLFTDGTVRRDGNSLSATITQSKPATVAVIRDLVGAIAKETITPARRSMMPSGRMSDCLPLSSFRLPTALVRALFAKAGIETDADLPGLVTRLSVEARESMFAAMMAADGDKRSNFSKKRRPGTMEAWRILCALRGIATGALHIREHNIPLQRARRTRHMHGSRITVEKIGIRPVWCPTTDYGTWVMEQDGVVVITGNSKALGRALGALGFGTAQAIEEDGEARRPVDSPVDRQSKSPRKEWRPGPAVTPQALAGTPDLPTGALPAANLAPPSDLATEAQLRRLYAAAEHHKWSKVDMQSTMYNLYGIESSKQLDRFQASRLIDLVEGRLALDYDPDGKARLRMTGVVPAPDDGLLSVDEMPFSAEVVGAGAER